MELYGNGRDFGMVQAGFGGRTLLAHAYVPWQEYGKVYSPQESLCKGTIFPDLWGVYKIPR